MNSLTSHTPKETADCVPDPGYETGKSDAQLQRAHSVVLHGQMLFSELNAILATICLRSHVKP